MSQKSNWINNEKITVRKFQEWGIPAEWVSKMGREESKSIHDVDIFPQAPIHFKIDSKFTKGGLAHHTKLNVIEEKYCKKDHERPVLFSRTIGARYGTFTVKDSIFLGLLSYFLGYRTKEEVLRGWGVGAKTSSDQKD